VPRAAWTAMPCGSSHRFRMGTALPGIGHKRQDLTAYPVLFWPVRPSLPTVDSEVMRQTVGLSSALVNR
jgi:hypothetical protein